MIVAFGQQVSKGNSLLPNRFSLSWANKIGAETRKFSIFYAYFKFLEDLVFKNEFLAILPCI